MTNARLVPMIVAVALFMDNMDSTVIATSLPAIAADIGTSPLTLKLAVTSYLLSLAVFIPMSGWTADRFGARTVFRAAIAVFVLGSIGCALSGSIAQFVMARIVQGMGGAMMTPVGRLVLVRTVDRRELVNAMAWVSIPAMIGPLMGPPLGGFITTYFSWHWIFLINVPIGLVGIVLVTRYIENVRAEAREGFDAVGMVLSGIAVAGLTFGLSVAGFEIVPWPVVVAILLTGAVAAALYVAYARRVPAPILDFSLLKLPTFRASLVGGFLFRIGVGAMPFLLPLLLQVGFNLTPLRSGLITFTSTLGALFMKAAAPRMLKRFGFRQVLIWNAILGGLSISLCATSRFDAILGDDRDPDARRLLPLAAIHLDQCAGLCRSADVAHEPRHRARRGRPAGVAGNRRGARCAHRRTRGAAERRCRHHGVGLSASLPAGRSDRRSLGFDLHAAAAECRRRDGQPGAADHRGVGPTDGMTFSAAPGMVASKAARR